MISPSLIYKYNIITLCTMFNTKPEHGDIYINCKNFIKLINNFYIHSTPPLSVLEFPKEYFPFTQNSENPVIFTNTYMFNLNDSLICPENKVTTDIKMTCLIITFLYLFSKRSHRGMNIALNEHRDPISLLSYIYNSYYTSSKSTLNNNIRNNVSYIDIESLVSYLVDNIFRHFSSFETILNSYNEIYGVNYDFFR